MCVCVCVLPQWSLGLSAMYGLWVFCVQSLTGGNGFYLPDCKEMVWPDRRLVVQDKKTGET